MSNGLQPWLPAQDSPEVVVNENFEALSHLATYAKDPTTTTGLTWGYAGGRWGGHLIAPGTLALPANQTLYITVERSTGAISASAAATAWNNTAINARVYKVTTGAATVTAAEDHRAGDGGVHGIGAAATSLAGMTDVDFGTPSNGQVLTWHAASGKARWQNPPAGGGGGTGGGGSGDANIVGIVLVAEGGGAGTWDRVGTDFEPLATDTAFFNAHPTYAGIMEQFIDDQHMVKIPAFWIKAGSVPSGTYAGKRFWMISNQEVEGFELHPAFMDAGLPLEQYWVGKYQGTNDGGTKLGSFAGVMPLVSINFSTMQARAAARNTAGVTGFALWNYYQLAAIQLLCLIEIGGADSQALIGQGHVSGSAALAVEHATVAQATWRGIVGLWGNVYQMVDGLTVNGSSQYVIWDKLGNKTQQTTAQVAPASNYPVSVSIAQGSSYDLRQLFLPASTASSASDGTLGDCYYKSANTVAYHGGYWSDGALAGLFGLIVIGSASGSGKDIGGRLAKV